MTTDYSGFCMNFKISKLDLFSFFGLYHCGCVYNVPHRCCIVNHVTGVDELRHAAFLMNIDASFVDPLSVVVGVFHFIF